jgi:hypothetical protein
MDLSSSDNNIILSSNTITTTRMGTFGNLLYPKVAMTCNYSDSTPTVPAEKVFLVSNASGSATRCLCLLCPSSQPVKNNSHNKNPEQLRIFSLDLEKDDNDDDDDVSGHFVVHADKSIQCVTVLPIQSSPIPKTRPLEFEQQCDNTFHQYLATSFRRWNNTFRCV